MRGRDGAGRYLRELQRHVTSYSQSMSSNVRIVAGGDADAGVVDAAMARQYSKDGAPIYIIYPRDGTSYWLTGAAITKWCTDGEMAYAFLNWLFSDDVDGILRRNHIYLTYTSDTGKNVLDAKGDGLALFPVKKTIYGRRPPVPAGLVDQVGPLRKGAVNGKIGFVSLGCSKNLIDTGSNAWHSPR